MFGYLFCGLICIVYNIFELTKQISFNLIKFAIHVYDL